MGRFGLILIFGLLNFGALGIGGLLMGDGPSSQWYEQLNKAPWTPPGWVFGLAWTLLMICFTIYMAIAVPKVDSRWIWILFALQFVTNIAWNYLFFNQHLPFWALIDLTLLTGVVWFMFFRFKPALGLSSIWIVPYMAWLLVALSLNAYAWLKN